MKLKITFLFIVQILLFYQVGAQCTGADFEERNGIAILEMETKKAGSWNVESISGASAGKALTYRGTSYFSTPGNSTITYSVRINSPGTYRFAWRSKISILDPVKPSSEHNDTWLKINGSDFYGQRSSHIVYPIGSGKSPLPNGAGSDGWFKIWTSTTGWSWQTFTSDRDPHNIYAKFNSAGVYTIQISGRSTGHTVDRMILYKTSSYSSSQAENLALAQTNCSGGSTPPPPTTGNVDPEVSFSNLTEGQSFSVGSTIPVKITANDSDGSIVKHQVYVNNTLVDTDGSNYTTHNIANAKAGNYAIKVVVTDNSGATDTEIVNIVVGTSTTPPTPPTTPGSGDPTVDFSNLTEGQGFASGSTISIGVSANDPNGSIVKHQIYVNGKLVDTDGSGYTPHKIVNANDGNYAIEAVVTDNSGATAAKTVNVVVGGGTTPPPTPPTTGNAAPTVSFSNLSEGQGFAVGSTVSIGVSSSDTDGSVVKYQVFVDGVLRDTDGSNYTPHRILNISEGVHSIKVEVTDNDGAVGSVSISIVAGSSTTPPPPPSAAISFTLVNSLSNADISPITAGSVLSRTSSLNIRASTSLNAKSIVLNLTGTANVFRIENVSPYALFGDIGGNYLNGSLPNGSYTLKADAYSASNGTGSNLGSSTINFTVNDASSGKIGLISAFPNPVLSDGRVSLKLPKAISGNVVYYVTSTSGVLIEKGSFSTESTKDSVGLSLTNVGNQESGVYYLSVQSNQGKQTIPLIRL